MHRIRLSTDEFEGRNNAYLFAGDGPTTLVDTGVSTPDVRRQLEAGLADADLTVVDVDAVLLTHWHYDHAGLAGHVQSVSDATVYVHEADVPMVARPPRETVVDLAEERLVEWAVPVAKREELRAVLERSARLAGDGVEVEPLTRGDRLRAGDETLRVIHTPGHTAGQITLVSEDASVALVGDAVLPVYTPNVGGADLRVEHPLSTYLTSLTTIDEAGFDRLYPGHRDPIGDPTDRIEAILDHHHERTRHVLDVLADRGPSTVWEVSTALFGDLDGIHVLHGTGEAFAHLDDLVARREVERSGAVYRLSR